MLVKPSILLLKVALSSYNSAVFLSSYTAFFKLSSSKELCFRGRNFVWKVCALVPCTSFNCLKLLNERKSKCHWITIKDWLLSQCRIVHPTSAKPDPARVPLVFFHAIFDILLIISCRARQARTVFRDQGDKLESRWNVCDKCRSQDPFTKLY